VLFTAVWLELGDAVELGNVVHDTALELHYRHAYYGMSPARPAPCAACVRRMLVQLVGQLALRQDGESLYSFDRLLTFLWGLAPDLLGRQVGQGNRTNWWFEEPGWSRKRLQLGARKDWERVWRPLVEAILSGPMKWLGLIDIVEGDHRPSAFRIRAVASILAGREPIVDEAGVAAPLTVSLEREPGLPVVVVPAGTADVDVYTWLARLGELTGASIEGLRYRLTPERVQMAFDDGLTGPALTQFLDERVDGSLPEDVQTVIERWWQGYGRVRLYDDLTLIELGDDVLLRELAATTSLSSALVHTFSPRIIAVDPARVDAFIEELTRSGHTPRVVQEV
jgi:hypothetical protein